MAHVFNYLLSESTFAFEVSRDRIRGWLHRRMEILSYALYSVAYIRTRCTEMHNAHEIKNVHWIINEMFSRRTTHDGAFDESVVLVTRRYIFNAFPYISRTYG